MLHSSQIISAYILQVLLNVVVKEYCFCIYCHWEYILPFGPGLLLDYLRILACYLQATGLSNEEEILTKLTLHDTLERIMHFFKK